MPQDTLSPWTEAMALARREGLDLFGLVRACDFDRSQPPGRRSSERLAGCGTILVLGSGGRRFWQSTWPHGMPAAPGRSPLHHRSAAITRDVIALLGEHDLTCRASFPEERRPLNFVQLGEFAGMGTVSPVTGQLLHPEFGPWISLRAAILIEGTRPGTPWSRSITSSFQPCATCQRPCVTACPVAVYDDHEAPAFERCATRRHAGGCATGCESRRACPVGSEHRYDAQEEAFRHAHSLPAMKAHYGLGAWRLVPGPVRRWLCS